MNKILKIFLFIFSIVILSGCVVKENITFYNNKRVNYSMNIDATQALSAISLLDKNLDLKSIQNKDTLISVKSMLEKSTVDNRIKQMVEPASPLRFHIVSKEKQLNINILGEFDSVESLNKAFSVFSQVVDLVNSTDSEEGTMISQFFKYLETQTINFYWDGHTMKRMVESVGKDNKQMDQILQPIFSQSQWSSKYNFEKTILTNSNKNCLLSTDRKSATTNNSYNTIQDTPSVLNIKLEIK